MGTQSWPALTKSRRLVSPGIVCEQSEKPDTWDAYNEEEMYLDLVELFSRFHGRSNVLVAHSFGTCLATRLAGSHPLALARVEALVLAGTRPDKPPGALSSHVTSHVLVRPLRVRLGPTLGGCCVVFGRVSNHTPAKIGAHVYL